MKGYALLTDEELAAIESLHRERQNGIGMGYCVGCSFKWPCHEIRLISDLRAARAEKRPA